MCFKTNNMKFKMAFSLKKSRAEARASSLEEETGNIQENPIEKFDRAHDEA